MKARNGGKKRQYGLDAPFRRDVLRALAAGGAAMALSPYLASRAVAARKALALPETIAEAGKRFREGSLTSKELTKAYLKCVHQLEPELNAFITVTEDNAIETAAALDRELKAGNDRGRYTAYQSYTRTTSIRQGY